MKYGKGKQGSVQCLVSGVKCEGCSVKCLMFCVHCVVCSIPFCSVKCAVYMLKCCAQCTHIMNELHVKTSRPCKILPLIICLLVSNLTSVVFLVPSW